MGRPSNLKDSLMAYPKEVIVDYLLEDGHFYFDIDFRKLEFRKCQARSKKLLEEWEQIEAHLKRLNLKSIQGRAEYWRMHGRIDQIMAELDRLSRKTSALLSIAKEVLTDG